MVIDRSKQTINYWLIDWLICQSSKVIKLMSKGVFVCSFPFHLIPKIAKTKMKIENFNLKNSIQFYKSRIEFWQQKKSNYNSSINIRESEKRKTKTGNFPKMELKKLISHHGRRVGGKMGKNAKNITIKNQEFLTPENQKKMKFF